jgi:hypothetical protein
MTAGDLTDLAAQRVSQDRANRSEEIPAKPTILPMASSPEAKPFRQVMRVIA